MDKYNPSEIEPKWLRRTLTSPRGLRPRSRGARLRGKQIYNPGEIELKWQKRWEKSGLYQAKDLDRRPKKYLLIEFPYPSGERLHVGHGRSYTCVDALARKYRMRGYNVLFPIGWDAFGLPAENYAIKTGVNPAVTTAQNIANAKKQAKQWGLSFDWSREINTTDPRYYRWTQWIFLKLLEKGLAYRTEVPNNWCPTCKTNLADEEVLADGNHERCGQKTEKRRQKQWLLKITAYAERLLEDLKTVDYLPKIAQQQINWIGRSEGVEIKFKIQNSKFKVDASQRDTSEVARRDSSDGEGIGERAIRVFTTAHDTIFGATFMVLSPEYAEQLLDLVPKEKKQEVSNYIKISLNKSEQQRKTEIKKKTGVAMGLKAVNPFTNQEIPIYVADYVLMSYGTGAIMGVPGHDARDHDFAKKYNLPTFPVIQLRKGWPCEAKIGDDGFWDYEEIKTKYGDKSLLFNSGLLDGLTSDQAKKKIEEEIVRRGIGKKIVNYHLRDWVFSRQHYWGEPIPVVYCQNCAQKKPVVQPSIKTVIIDGGVTTNFNGVEYAVVLVPEEQLPVELPYIEKYQPTGTGESPLAAVKEWVKTKCPRCGESARRETDTMPNWAGSNWYFLGYLVAKSLGEQKSKIKNQKFIDIFTENKKIINYWMPIDLYNGGMEHTTLHLLYSRFIYKFLFDLGVVPNPEPYAARRSHGVVLGPDGQKMSKSRGNVVNPDEVIAAYGADTFRLYEAFMGPFDQMIPWSEEGVEGCFRFLKRIWQLALSKTNSGRTSGQLLKKLNQTVLKVDQDLEKMKFNTAVAALMEFVKSWQDDKEGLSKEDLAKFLLILAPLAPHISEELWQRVVRDGRAEVARQQFSQSDGGALRSGAALATVQKNTPFRSSLGGTPSRALIRSGLSKIATHHPLSVSAAWSIHQQLWPVYNPKLIKKEMVTIVIEVNGKVRDKVSIKYQVANIKQEVEKLAKESEKIKRYLKGKKIKQTVFVPGKLINFVV